MWKKSLVRIDKSNIIKANLYMGCGRNYKAQPNIKGRQNPSIFRALSFCILFILSLFFLSVFSLPNKALAAFNEQINYQGKLFSSTSMAVADGDYNFTFRLYTSASGGSPIWTEECTTTNTVNVRSGLFSHMLGSVNPLSDAIFNQDLYLSVDVGGTTTIPSWDGEMSPRKHLGSVASAFEAKRLSGKTETQFATLAEGETITGSWTHQNSLIISSSTAATLFTITQGGAGTAAEIMGKVAIATSTANAQLTVQGTSTTALVSILTSAGNSALFASSSGFIGINTSTPSYNLDVAGDINISGALRIAGSDLSQYFIDSAGTSGQLWSSDSAGRGAWLSTSSLGLSMDYISGSSSLAYLSGNNIFTGYNIFASTTFNGTSTFGDVIISNLTSTNAHFTNIVGFFGANCGMDNYAYGINPDGTLNCRPDVSGGGGVGGGWATTSDNKRLYPANVAHIVVIGGNVTSSQDTIFETIGNAYIKGNLRAESVTTSDLEATNTTLLNILNVTGPTQLASTTINGSTTMANATATNLGITSNLNVAGQSALGNVSSTNVTISGALTWSTNNGLLEAVSGVVRATSTANFLTTGNASALYVPYTYASSVFSTYAYNTSTFVTYSYGSSTYATTNHTHAQLHDPVTENILGIDLTGQTLSLTSGYFIPTTSPAFASVTTTNLYPTNIIGATNISTTNLTASGNTVLANATGTNLNLTGALFIGGNNLSQYFISSAGTAGQLWASDGSGAGGWVNTSTLGLSYTDLRDNSNLALLNANNTFTGTNTFASTTINGTTTMANATATNLGITSNLNVAGQTNFVTASGTAATLSGNQWVGGALYVTGQTSLGNVSSTNLTVSNNSYLGTIKSGTWNGSVIDISSYTNLSAGSGIVLTGDALSHDTANGYIHIPANGASTQLLQYSSAGTAKWITMSGDASIADNGAIAVADDSHAHTGATISGSLVLTGASSTYATATWALLGNASTTNLTVSNNSYLGTIKSGTWNGSIIGAAYLGSGSPSANTLLFGDGAWKATSTLGLSYTDLRDNSNLALLNANNTFTGTNTFASTTINGTTTMANATATNLGITSNLNVAGQTNLGNASTTALTNSGNSYLQNISFTTASGTALTLSSNQWIGGALYVTGQTSLGNASTTNLTISGNSYLGTIISGSGTITNISSTGITATNLYPTNIIGATNISTTNLTASGNTVLANATGTNLNLTGALFIGGNNLSQYFISSAGTAGQLWASDGSGAGGWVNTSTLGLSYTDLRDNSNLALLNANNTFTGTNTFASTTINGTTTMANATATNLGITSNLNVAGQTNFVTASGTAATLSGNQWVGGALYVTGQTSLGNVSSTNLTVSNNSYLGTIKSGTWNGSIIGAAYLGSGSPSANTLLFGDGAWKATSTLGLSYTDLRDNSNLALLNANNTFTGTNTFASTTINGTTTMANATATNLGITSNLNVAGQTNLGNASGTNLTISNNLFLSTLSGGSIATSANLATSVLALDTALNNLFTNTKEPTGFPNRTDTAMSFNNTTRDFTITGANFKVYSKGREYVKNTESINIPNLKNLYYVYYHPTTQVLTTSTVDWNMTDGTIQIATVFWSPTAAEGLLGEERHGLIMDGMTHEYLHQTVGTRYNSGLTGVFTDPANISITAGSIYDEDILLSTTTNQTQCRVLYRDAPSAFIFTARQNSYIQTNGGNIAYDNGGVLTPVTNGQYVAYWIFATNDLSTPIYSLVGQRQDTSLTNARNNAKYESLTLTGLPFREMKLLYRVILHRTGNGSYAYDEAQDLRSISNLPSGTYLATAHNVLTGLDFASAGHTGFAGLDVENTFTGTNTFASTTINGTTTMANATATNLGITSNLNVAGQTNLANASGTALTLSGNEWVGGALYVTGQTSLGNASTTNLTVSGNSYLGTIISGSGTVANISSTGITVTNLYPTNIIGATNISTTNFTASGNTVLANATGTNLNLSGALFIGGNNLSQYFISSAGTAGQLWASDGSGAGGWVNTSTLGLSYTDLRDNSNLALLNANNIFTGTNTFASTTINGTTTMANATATNFGVTSNFNVAGFSSLSTTTATMVNIGTTSYPSNSSLAIQGVGNNPILDIYVSSSTSTLRISTNGNIGFGDTNPFTQFVVGGGRARIVTSSSFLTSNVLENGQKYGSYYYATFNNTGGALLHVVNVSDPENPTTTKVLATSMKDIPSGIDAKGKYLYIGSFDIGATSSLNVFDISDPNSPTFIASTTFRYVKSVSELKVVGNYVYAVGGVTGVAGDYDLGVEVFDVSNASAPASVGGAIKSGTYWGYSFDIEDTLLAVANSDNTNNDTIEFFDISSPATPQWLSSLSLGSIGNTRDIEMVNKFVYVANTAASNGFKIIDVRNRSNPNIVYSGLTDTSYRGVSVRGRYAYVFSGSVSSGEMKTLDISSSTNPVLVNRLFGLKNTMPSTVNFDGRYAYVADGTDQKLRIIDLGGGYIQEAEFGDARASSLVIGKNTSIGGALNVTGGLNVGQSLQVQDRISGKSLLVFATSTLQNVLPDMAGGTGNVSLYSLGASTTRWNSIWVSSTYIGSGTWQISQGANNQLSVFSSPGSNERLTISSNGYVGIGSTTPAYNFSVSGTIGVGGAYYDAYSTSGAFGMVLQTTGTTTKWVATSTLGLGGGSGTPGGTLDGSVQYKSGTSFAGESLLFWDATNKRLGIGTSTPTSSLEILETAKNPTLSISALTNVGGYNPTINFNTGSPRANVFRILYDSTDALGKILAPTAGAVESINISVATGRVGIYGDPDVATYELKVNGDAWITGNLLVDGNTIMNGDLTVNGITSLATTTISGTLDVQGTSTFTTTTISGTLDVLSTTTLADLIVTGNPYWNGGGPFLPIVSDARLKNIEANLNGKSLNLVMALHPVQYRFNELGREISHTTQDRARFGFIAQEMGAVIPEFLMTNGEYYSLNESGLEAILTAAIQEQQAQISNFAYPEQFSNLEEGDIIYFSTSTGEVVKTSKPYQTEMFGVAAIGGKIVPFGRTKVKVSADNGEIKKGDYITSGINEGIGIKATSAGRILGMALENMGTSSQGLIEVYINPQWSGNDLSVQIDANGQMINNPVVSSLRNQLTDIGLVVGEDGTLEVKALKAQKVITNEFETVDKATGQTYCLWIENGDWKKTVGACQGAAAAVMPSGGGDVIVPPPFEQNVASTSPTSSTNVDIPAIDAPATTTDSVVPVADPATSSPPIETPPVDIPPVAEVSPTPLNVAPEVPPPDPVIVTPPTDSTVEAPIQ